ncbi:MAG: VWD domain-containing protein [Chitinophagaceae bacterium]|nr:VWD domain-containing protein [Chitinophagaceae bacterium]
MMFVRHSTSLYGIAIVFMLCLWAAGCKKINAGNTPEPAANTQPDMFFITDIVGSGKYIGFIVNDPIDKKQYAAFGPKNEKGQMDSIKFIMENFTENGEWLSHELDENFLPKETTTSTGHTIEYTDIDAASNTGSVRIKETTSGKVLWEKSNLPLPDNFYDLADGIKEHQKNGKYNEHPGKADLLYLGSNMAGCFIGAAALGAGGPVAVALGAYNTYQSCKSAVGALSNMMEGNPAFGCMAAEDHANALSAFGETYLFGGSLGGMAKGGLPTLIGYALQTAGQGNCNDDGNGPPPLPQLPPRDAGVSWGDPHLITPDGVTYDFHGVGEFIAVKSLTDNFEVQVRLGNPYVENPQTTYNTGIAVHTGKDIVSYSAEKKKLWINNTEHSLQFTHILLTGNAFIKKEPGQKYDRIIIQHLNGDQVVLLVSGITYIDYHLRLTDNRKQKIQGLMGNYDGDPDNDLALRNGTSIQKKHEELYPKFADDWRIEQSKSLFFYEPGKNTESYTRKDLPKTTVAFDMEKYTWAEQVCKSAGVQDEPFLSGCIVDVYTSGNAEVAQSAVNALEAVDNIDFPPLDMSNIILQSDAIFVDNSIRLTRNSSYIAGQAYNKSLVTGDFETSFAFRFGLSANGGADGLALVMAKQIPQPAGNAYPGRSGKLGYNGVPASLAVEFDSSIDFNDEDESPNHVAIHTNGKDANGTGKPYRIAFNKNIPLLEDGLFHSVRVQYKNKTIKVWMDGSLAIEKNIDLKTTLGFDNGCYLGLTASTSSSSQAHYIHSWEIKAL